MIWIVIIIEIASFIGLAYSNEIADEVSLIKIFSVFGLITSLIAIHIVLFQALFTEPVSYEYPTDEYVLEYKVTTIGEKSDTIYVLTKIKEE